MFSNLIPLVFIGVSFGVILCIIERIISIHAGIKASLLVVFLLCIILAFIVNAIPNFM